jgi:hypothetical protein
MIIDAVLSLGDPCCGLLALGFVIGGCLLGISQLQKHDEPTATDSVYVYGQQTEGQPEHPMGQYPMMAQQVMYYGAGHDSRSGVNAAANLCRATTYNQ